MNKLFNRKKFNIGMNLNFFPIPSATHPRGKTQVLRKSQLSVKIPKSARIWHFTPKFGILSKVEKKCSISQFEREREVSGPQLLKLKCSNPALRRGYQLKNSFFSFKYDQTQQGHGPKSFPDSIYLDLPAQT